MANKKEKKVVYYTDLLNDDFAGTGLETKPLKANYHYVNKNPVYKFFSYLIYFLIAFPILYVVGKVWRGVRVKGKKNLKVLKGQGAFFYGNHTQIVDAFMVQAYLVPTRRTYIIADRAAFSIRGLRWLLKMMGMLPIPGNGEETSEFLKAIEYRHSRTDHIVIFPEAHIWPFYTGIRPFKGNSFIYPARLLAPVVPMCVTYRQRKIFKNATPRMTLHVGEVIYPDSSLPLPERCKALRDKCYAYMVDVAGDLDNYEYIEYRKKEGEQTP